VLVFFNKILKKKNSSFINRKISLSTSQFFFHLENFGKHFPKIFLRQKGSPPPKNKEKFGGGEKNRNYIKKNSANISLIFLVEREICGVGIGTIYE
jgi:hypothetical protein